MDDELWILIVIVVGAVALIALLGCGVAFANLRFIENVPVIVLVDGKEVYRGINGCVDVTSAGYSTQVKVSGGFLCFKTKATYVSKNVVVSGQEAR